MSKPVPPSVAEYAVGEREQLLARVAELAPVLRVNQCAETCATCAGSIAPEPAQGEAVEIVGTRYSRVSEQGRTVNLVRLSRKRRYEGWDAEDRMTVAQHNRIMAAAKPDATLVELLARCQEKLDPHRDAVLWGAVVAALMAAP